jgi:hypothetical protein
VTAIISPLTGNIKHMPPIARMTNHPYQPCFLADEGVGLDANRATYSHHYFIDANPMPTKKRSQ